jgi:hypothetical protein
VGEQSHYASASAAPAVEAPPQSSQTDSRVLERVLGMADRYREDNLLRQAAEMYFEVVERHSSAPERDRACQRLLEIAEHYEDIGAPHQARGIYERLL